MKNSSKTPIEKTPSGFRFLDHTADTVIEAWGSSIEDAFEQWRGSNEQIDDVCVFAIRN